MAEVLLIAGDTMNLYLMLYSLGTAIFFGVAAWIT
jgi:hypothetical protein